MKYRMRQLAAVMVLSFLMIGCAAKDKKEFKENVDKFCEYYDRYAESDDLIEEDITLKCCRTTLSNIAKMYEDSDLQKEYNEYIRQKLTYQTIKPVLDYDDEYQYDRKILRSQLVEYIKNR